VDYLCSDVYDIEWLQKSRVFVMYKIGTTINQSEFRMRYVRRIPVPELPWCPIGSTQVLGEYHSSSSLVLPSLEDILKVTKEPREFFSPDANQPEYKRLDELVIAGKAIWGGVLKDVGISDVITRFTVSFSKSLTGTAIEEQLLGIDESPSDHREELRRLGIDGDP